MPFSLGDAAADHRRKLELAVPGLGGLHTQHAAVEERAHRAAGVVVVRDHHVGPVVADWALAVLVQTVPTLPNRGCAHADLIQPAGTLCVQQHLVGSVGVAVVGQRKQDVRRAREACADLVVVLLNQLDQILGSLRLDVFREHIQVQGQHIGGLEFFLRLAVSIGQHTAIGIGHLTAQLLVLGGVLGLAKDACNFRQCTAGVAQGRRSGVLAAGLPLTHLRHIGGDPVSQNAAPTACARYNGACRCRTRPRSSTP